jgi:hypothetical protein
MILIQIEPERPAAAARLPFLAMVDDPPSRSAVSYHNKSQTVRVQRVSATTRSKIVTRPRMLSLLVSLLRANLSCLAAQPGRKTSLPHPKALIMNPHPREARMAHPTQIVLTCHKTLPQDQAANTAGSRSLVDAQCYRRRTCLGLSLLLLDMSEGLPSSVLVFPTGTIAA